MKALYTAIASAHGGREGHVRSSDGALEADLKVPKGMGGAGEFGTNPEQLFAAGYAACFQSALFLVAKLQHKELKDSTVTAHVTLNVTDDKHYDLSVELHCKVEGPTPEEARALVDAAHQVCPYSRATRGNVEVNLVVE